MSYTTPPPGGDYGQPQYAAAAPKTNGKAITAMILGILGIFPCCSLFVFSILGIVFGKMATKEIAASGGAQTGAGMAKAGFITGVVGVVLGILYWVLVATGVIDVNAYSDMS